MLIINITSKVLVIRAGPLRYPATQPFPLRLFTGEGERGMVGRTYLRPKDSNIVVGVRDRQTRKRQTGMTVDGQRNKTFRAL